MSSIVLHFCVDFLTAHAYIALRYEVHSSKYASLASHCEPDLTLYILWQLTLYIYMYVYSETVHIYISS